MNKLQDLLFTHLPAGTSVAGTLDETDLKKTLRLLIVAVAGAGATAALDFATQFLAGVDLGSYKVIVMPLLTALLEIARRWVASNLNSADVL